MKKLLLLNIIFIALSTPVQAATVKAFATDVRTTYIGLSDAAGNSIAGFSDTAGSSIALSNTDIQSTIASNLEAAVYGNSPADYSIIDLGFGSNTAVTGSGADLTVFSLWSGYDYSFGLNAYDKNGDLLSGYKYDVNNSSVVFGECASESCLKIVTTSINLFDNAGLELADDVELGYLSLFIGGSLYNGATGGTAAYSNFSLVGAFNTKATVVPLPLSAVLFGSGLALLGWTGRKKKA